jgi:hypothetical protein
MEKTKMADRQIGAKSAGIAEKAISIIAFLWCGQSIAFSSSPVFFSALAALTFAAFLFTKGNAGILFATVACGPVINLTALRHDAYVYNVEIVLLTWLACRFWKNGPRDHPFSRDSLTIAFGAFFAIVLASCALHVMAHQSGTGDELRLARGFFIGGLMLVFLKNQPDIPGKWWYRPLTAAALATAGWGLGETARALTSPSWNHSPHALFDGSEMLAMYLCAVIPLLRFGTDFEISTAWKTGGIAAETGSVALLLATRSRAALIAIALFYAVFACRKAFRGKDPGISLKRLLTFFLPIPLIAAAMLVVARKTFTGAPFSFDKAASLLFSSRMEPWAKAIAGFRSHPLWGAGAGDNAYNLPLQVLCQFGIFGLLAFCVVLAIVFFRNTKPGLPVMHPALHRGALWSGAAFLVASLAESAMGNQFSYFALFVLFMAGAASTAAARREV